MQNLRVAVDVGGTFTDICIMDEATGLIRIEKTSTTRDPIEGIMGGVSKAGIDLSKVALFSHGTTVATNALITRRLAAHRRGLTTEGFRDVIEIRRANKEDLWDTYKDVVKPYVPRRDRLTVPERIDAAGKVIQPLDTDAARKVARILKRRGVAAIAVCFMNAYLNGENERAMRDILLAEMPDIPVSISSRGAARNLRARAILDHGRQRRRQPGRRRATRAASAIALPTKATRAISCCCTPAAAS